MIKYDIIRSNRKTIAIEVSPKGVIVRAPNRATKREIEAFVREKDEWINKHIQRIEKLKEQSENLPKLTAEEIKELAEKARTVIPPKVEYYAKILKVTYGKITIRNQKTRRGSCSSAGNLNFNCLLMKFPDEIIDYVVVHELCHRKYMNHSKEFYAQIEQILSDYKAYQKYLKEQRTIFLQT